MFDGSQVVVRFEKYLLLQLRPSKMRFVVVFLGEERPSLVMVQTRVHLPYLQLGHWGCSDFQGDRHTSNRHRAGQAEHAVHRRRRSRNLSDHDGPYNSIGMGAKRGLWITENFRYVSSGF